MTELRPDPSHRGYLQPVRCRLAVANGENPANIGFFGFFRRSIRWRRDFECRAMRERRECGITCFPHTVDHAYTQWNRPFQRIAACMRWLGRLHAARNWFVSLNCELRIVLSFFPLRGYDAR
jgi:hypothetical protein